MSTCISRQGEYGEHQPGAGTERFTCQRCFVFDEHAAMATLAELEALLDQAASALTTVGKKALVVKPTLDKPYPDDPSWTPWTRFLEEPAREAFNLGAEIKRRLRAGGSQ